MYSLIGRNVSDSINPNPIYFEDGIAITPYKTVVYFGRMLMSVIGTTREKYVCCLPYKSVESSFFSFQNICYCNSNIRQKVKQFVNLNYSNVLHKLVQVETEECTGELDYAFLMNEAEADAIRWEFVPSQPQVFWTRSCNEDGTVLSLEVKQDKAYKRYEKPNKFMTGCRPIFLLNSNDSLTISGNQLFM
jgi:hypothetical protein